MPPRLHPRSKFTSSLFATTLFASFFVVALPHALPCPAPRVSFADGEMSDGTPRKRRRRKFVEKEAELLKECEVVEDSEADRDIVAASRAAALKRECPIPKPGGIVGDMFGFKPSSSDGKGSKPP